MSHDKLAYMANQIGEFFAHQPHDKAVLSIEDTSGEVLGPADARTILTHFDEDEGGLDPLVRQAD